MSASPLGTFLSKFDDWRFCPPSDHLWTISFALYPRNTKNISDNSFAALYNNIINVNTRHYTSFSSKWKIETPNNINSYIAKSQDSSIGFFLATDVSFNTNSTNINEGLGNNVSYTGWINHGKIQTGRNQNHNIKITFNKTNWDINEIFFDRWIAAIGQQGLIEDDSLLNLKANITIREYACGAPGNTSGVWIPRKQINIIRAFPTSRQEAKYSYDDKEAGILKSETVSFIFDDYQIRYFEAANIGGTPGYIEGTTSVGTSEVGPDYTLDDIYRLKPEYRNYK